MEATGAGAGAGDMVDKGGRAEKEPASAEAIVVNDDEPPPSVGRSCNNILEFVSLPAVTTTLSSSIYGNATETVDRYPMDLHIKDELPEASLDDDITEEVEPDPMDLLELSERCASERQDEEEHETSSSVSSNQTGCATPNTIKEWMREYPWLLYEEKDESCGYCLYCDTKLSVRFLSNVKQHALSLYHKERSVNYLAFRESEERAGHRASLVEIKQEFGTRSSIAALKLERKSQVEALNNFNWCRWLRDYNWLERDRQEGTVGRCKLCRIRLNVEFTYLRDRHQESTRHKEAISGSTTFRAERDKQTTDEEEEEEEEGSTSSSQHLMNTIVPENKWLEVDSVTNMCRCRLCDTVLIKASVPKHVKTKLHCQNIRTNRLHLHRRKMIKNVYSKVKKEERGQSSKNFWDWKAYGKQHPWLVGDPNDASFAFCKYCQKRLLWGGSAAKRFLHENSVQHKNAAKNFKKRESSDEEPQRNAAAAAAADDDDENDAGMDGVGDGKTVEDFAELNEENANVQIESNNDESQSDDNGENKNKRCARGSSGWFKQFPWCRKYAKNPSKYMYCIYCKLALAIQVSRTKHQGSARHRAAEKEFLRKDGPKERHHGYLAKEKHSSIYPWLMRCKNNSNMIYCKYCHTRFSKYASRMKHQKSERHRMCTELYFSKLKTLDSETSNQVARAPSSLKTKDVAKSSVPQTFAAKVMLWKMKYPWLLYKRGNVRLNYAFCKICKQSIFVPSAKYALKHQRSAKHLGAIELGKQTLPKEPSREGQMVLPASVVEGGDQEHSEQQTLDAIASSLESKKKSSWEQLTRQFPWLKPSTKKNYGYCCYCRTQLVVKVSFMINHQFSQKHKLAEQRFIEATKPSNVPANASRSCYNVQNDVAGTDGDDVVACNEESDSCSIKSEPMDQREELEYLLQRSLDGDPRKSRRKDRSDNPSKRSKRNENPSLAATILSSPLALAACLGPILQQHLQPPVQLGAPPTAENTFDLFFKSISETMKKLPADLAAEGKVRVMQVICDLEVKALQRQQTVELGITTGTISHRSSDSNAPSTTTSAAASATTAGPKTHPQQESNVCANSRSLQMIDNQQITEETVGSSTISSMSGRHNSMDKNGAHHFKMKALMPKQTRKEMNGGDSSLRCIPLKTLTQTLNNELNSQTGVIDMRSVRITPYSLQSPSQVVEMSSQRTFASFRSGEYSRTGVDLSRQNN